MPAFQIKREFHKGVLIGNGIARRCRVEFVIRTAPGLPTLRQLDIWIDDSPPEGNYKLSVNGSILAVRFARGAWLEAAA